MRKLIVVIGMTTLLALSAANAGQMRGLWVDAWNPGFKNAEQTAAMVEKARDCKFNALFVQVRRRGDVYYQSKIEPMAREVAPGYDPLADIVKKAHAANMQVHAWLVVYEVYHENGWKKPDPGMVHVKHPEWLMKGLQGNAMLPGKEFYIDPGVPEVTAYLQDVIKEIVSNYEVDGIHLEAVRYPSREFGYNETSVARFNAEKGLVGNPLPDDDAWCSWRRAQVTEFMRLASKVVHSRKKAAFSAAVFTNLKDARDYRFQDWEAWIDQDLIDFAVPMAFSNEHTDYQAEAAAVVAAGKGKPVVIGQGGWRLPSAKSVAQIDYASAIGAKGTIVYDYASCCKPYKGDTTSLMDSLRTGRYSRAEDAPVFAR